MKEKQHQFQDSFMTQRIYSSLLSIINFFNKNHPPSSFLLLFISLFLIILYILYIHNSTLTYFHNIHCEHTSIK